MVIDVTMPKLGLNMTDGTLARWLVVDGAPVKKGQPIFEVETDKVEVEVDAEEDGVLHHSVAEGTSVPVGELVGRIAAADEQVEDVAEAAGSAPRTVLPDRERHEVEEPEPAGREGEGLRASPRARQMMREAGIDWRTVKAAGRGGRITAKDVQAVLESTDGGLASSREDGAAPAPSASATGENHETSPSQSGDLRVPLQGIRRVIAQRMLKSSQQTAPVTLTTEADATELVRLHQEPGGAGLLATGAKLAYNDMVVKAVSRALREFPYMNAQLDGDEVRRVDEIAIGLAVDTERGLMVPVLRNADRLSLLEVHDAVIRLAERATSLEISPDELSGGTFTISNLGAYEIDAFTPIINLPELAILGVGRIVVKPVVLDRKVVARSRITLSLTFDHRLVDGAPAARFLQRIKQLLEQPQALLAE